MIETLLLCLGVLAVYSATLAIVGSILEPDLEWHQRFWYFLVAALVPIFGGLFILNLIFQLDPLNPIRRYIFWPLSSFWRQPPTPNKNRDETNPLDYAGGQSRHRDFDGDGD